MATLLVMILSSCLGEDEFQYRYDEQLCAWRAECFSESFDICMDEAGEAWEGTECEFDRGNARECLKGVEKLDCPGNEGESGLPFACDRVWDCFGVE